MQRRCLGWSAGLLALCGVVFTGMNTPKERPAARSAALDARLDLLTYEVQVLELPDAPHGAFDVCIELGGVAYELQLRPHTVRADGFQLLVQAADGSLRPFPEPAIVTYRGDVAGVPGSHVSGSLIHGRLSATIRFGEGELWFVQPAPPALGGGPGTHVVYRAEDVVPDEPAGCGAAELGPGDAGGGGSDEGDGGGIAATGREVCALAFDADYEYFTYNNSSVSDTVWDIESLMNDVETIYEGEVSITYEITIVVVRATETDPYTSSVPATLLEQFRTEWNTNLTGLPRDLTHLMTGRDLSGTTVGIAWTGTVCDTGSLGLAYGLSQSHYTANHALRVGLTAHELGHGWNATHCDGDADCHIMCSFIGGCSGVTNQFGSRSLSAIIPFRDNRPCLTNEPDPLGQPFFEQFLTWGELDDTRWTYHQGAESNLSAYNEVSSPFALNLDASGVGEYAGDEARTNFIQLGSVPSATLSYYTEHRGVEFGEQLVVEYWSNDFRWEEVNRITSDGVDQSNFVFWSHALPADALHNEFRVRFHALVNNANDDWFVDDLRVEHAAVPATLTIRSTRHSGVPITVSPADNGGQTDGQTEFVRTYDLGAQVTLTAPARPTVPWPPIAFYRWNVNGVDQPDDQLVMEHDVTANAILTADYVVLGDMNADNNITNADIPAFLLAITARGEYEALYGDPVRRGDITGDGTFNNADIPGFVALLTP